MTIRPPLRIAVVLFGFVLLTGGCTLEMEPTLPTETDPPPATPLPDRFEKQALALLPQYHDELTGLVNAPYYRIEAAVNPQEATVDGRLSLRYTNTTAQELTELVFRLFPNAVTIYGGGSLTVTEVRRAGEPLAFGLSPDRTVLRAPLEPGLKPGDTIALDLTFRAHIPSQVTAEDDGYGIFNQTLGVTALAGWYPVLALYDDGWQTPPVPVVGDAMVTQTSLFEVTLTVPATLEVASTGTAIQVEEGDGFATWHFVSGPAREFVVILSDRFQRIETEVDGIQVRFYALPDSQPNTPPERAVTIAADALRAYIRHFGPYPFTEFDVVEIAIPIGGYEFSGAVVTDDRLRTHEGAGNYRYILTHEVAHQWWYGLVGNRSVEDPWLDEALASYSALIYLEEVEGQAAADALLGWWKEQYSAQGRSNPPVDSSALIFGNWVNYHTVVYYQGALFLDAVRQEIGDERFFDVLRRYQAIYRHKIATTLDFIALLEAELGHRADAVFEQYFSESVNGREPPG